MKIILTGLMLMSTNMLALAAETESPVFLSRPLKMEELPTVDGVIGDLEAWSGLSVLALDGWQIQMAHSYSSELYLALRAPKGSGAAPTSLKLDFMAPAGALGPKEQVGQSMTIKWEQGVPKIYLGEALVMSELVWKEKEGVLEGAIPWKGLYAKLTSAHGGKSGPWSLKASLTQGDQTLTWNMGDAVATLVGKDPRLVDKSVEVVRRLLYTMAGMADLKSMAVDHESSPEDRELRAKDIKYQYQAAKYQGDLMMAILTAESKSQFVEHMNQLAPDEPWRDPYWDDPNSYYAKDMKASGVKENYPHNPSEWTEAQFENYKNFSKGFFVGIVAKPTPGLSKKVAEEIKKSELKALQPKSSADMNPAETLTLKKRPSR